MLITPGSERVKVSERGKITILHNLILNGPKDLKTIFHLKRNSTKKYYFF